MKTRPFEQRWMTIADAARLLDVHPQTLYRWTREGVIPASRIGKNKRTIRIDKLDLDDLLKKTVKADQEAAAYERTRATAGR